MATFNLFLCVPNVSPSLPVLRAVANPTISQLGLTGKGEGRQTDLFPAVGVTQGESMRQPFGGRSHVVVASLPEKQETKIDGFVRWWSQMNLREKISRTLAFARERGFGSIFETAAQEMKNSLIARSRNTTAKKANMIEALSNAMSRAPEYEEFRKHPPAAFDVRLLAYYLPQFHPIPENDEWWGKGFTEWTNVSKALPQFEGHSQPHLPGEMGFYDLRLRDVARRQAEMAKNYGIAGFCYYYYWFSGRRLLGKPVDDMLRDEEGEFPFCLVWANENWTRAWNGLSGELLIGQRYLPDDHVAFARDLRPYFEDRRYIRVRGRPLLMVYKPLIIPNLTAAVETWRREWARMGVPNPYLVAVQTTSRSDPRDIGFDAAAEFPPHLYKRDVTRESLRLFNSKFSGSVYDYPAMVDESLNFPQPDYPSFRGSTPGWDNTARRGSTATVFRGSSPTQFGRWIKGLVQKARTRDPEERIVFVNAWNEWAESAYLEPDRRTGYANLEQCRKALDVT